jgi:hypothetical protein
MTALVVEILDYSTRLLERIGGAKKSHQPVKVPRPQPRRDPVGALPPRRRKPTAAEWKDILGGTSVITVLPHGS